MNAKPVVVVAMSGGVDSSVAAALLVQQGYPVIGMMLRLWSEPGAEDSNRCCTPDSMAMARRVASRLDIPFYAVDAKDVFRDMVVQSFIDGHAQGFTPNPCLVCNRTIRWDFLLKRALSVGADYLATGHYARVVRNSAGQYEVRRSADAHKDQTYVLHVLEQEQLKHALFPLGELTKPQVRELAQQLGLSAANRPDSQDLCFLGAGDYRAFLQRQAPSLSIPGPITNRQGEILGEHNGLAFYTIGQRKGIGVAATHPYYVLEKDRTRNTLIIGTVDELGKDELTAAGVNWISGNPPSVPFQAEVKIRYKAHEASGVVTPLPENKVHIKFTEKLRDITPGQAAVFYQDEVCLGGGIIQP